MPVSMLALGLAATTKHLALPEGVFQQYRQVASRPSSISCLRTSCSISSSLAQPSIKAMAHIKRQGIPTANMPCNAITATLKQHRLTSLKPVRHIHLL